MFYGLIKKGKDIGDNLHKVLALAPCTVANGVVTVPIDYKEGLFKMESIGVYAFGGPNWSTDSQ